MGDFDFAERRKGDEAAVALSGELDMTATFRLEPAIDRLLEADGVRRLVLDLAGVDFVDSSGLGLLLATHERSAAADVSMSIVGTRPEISRVFELAGIRDVLPLSA
jgi:anti-anti-sigma factor